MTGWVMCGNEGVRECGNAGDQNGPGGPLRRCCVGWSGFAVVPVVEATVAPGWVALITMLVPSLRSRDVICVFCPSEMPSFTKCGVSVPSASTVQSFAMLPGCEPVGRGRRGALPPGPPGNPPGKPPPLKPPAGGPPAVALGAAVLSPVRGLRTGSFTFAPSGGVNRSAVDGTVSTLSAIA